MPVSGPEDKDPTRPSKGTVEGTEEAEADEIESVGVDVNEATLAEDDTLKGDEALAESRERHEEMKKEDEEEKT